MSTILSTNSIAECRCSSLVESSAGGSTRNRSAPCCTSGYPGLPYSAALLGRGSEVLGFDDEMSRDHNWEPRVLLFLRDADYARYGEAVERSLRDALPARFAGYPTQFSLSTLRAYLQEHLDLDVDAGIEARDWLTLPEQRLRMVTAGAVYHDEVGLQVLRDRLAYYPHDVWLYLMIAAWWRVHPEANLMGRAGFVGDELGSRVIAAQLVHDLMHLCFLMEKQYAPYSKWFGTAFSRLECASSLAPVLQGVLRRRHLVAASGRTGGCLPTRGRPARHARNHPAGPDRGAADVESPLHRSLGRLPRDAEGSNQGSCRAAHRRSVPHRRNRSGSRNLVESSLPEPHAGPVRLATGSAGRG